MAILLVGLEGRLREALVERLLAAGDDVRALAPDADAAARWRALGAHAAVGAAADPDLVERAAQGVRTVVVALRPTRAPLGRTPSAPEGVLESVVEGARAASPSVRLVVYADALRDEEREAVARVEHVVLLARGLRPPPAEAVAEAIDAADDLAGQPRVELDLRRSGAWETLGVTPPAGRSLFRTGRGRRGP